MLCSFRLDVYDCITFTGAFNCTRDCKLAEKSNSLEFPSKI